MTDRTSSLNRRQFITAALGTALATSVDLHAAPLLGRQRKRADWAPNSWIEVDLGVLEHNLGLVRQAVAGGARICAVMKADAYGVGIEFAIPTFIRAGIPYVGIASNEEARMARDCGFKGKLMRVRAATDEEVAGAARWKVEELVGSLASARAIGAIAHKRGRTADVHLALNSAGMSRNGLEMGSDQGLRDALEIVATPGLRIVGVMTHFPGEEPPELLAGLETFKRETGWLFAHTALRREDVLLHAANSFAVQHLPETHLDMVRPGGALYGYGGTPKPPFAHVASIKTRVASVQAYRVGDRVSYDGTWTLERDSLLANLPVGYSDGYRRAHSNQADVLVRGRRARVLGNVTMNTTMVDVTDIPGVRAGDEVVLFGAQGDERITQAEIEKISGVVLADQYTIWGASNPKIVRR